MNLVKRLALAVLLITLVTFVALFGRLPALRFYTSPQQRLQPELMGSRNTPIGLLHRLLCLHAPNVLRKIDGRITGGRLVVGGSRLFHYLANDKNPVVLIIFLSLVTGSAGLFLSAAVTRISIVHYFVIPFVLSSPYYFTYKCATTLSSVITKQNHADNMLLYPYDNVLYLPDKECRTCHFVKPARSKHCSTCKACIARHDHHCAWVNNCVGRDNYHWFLALLISLGVLLNYGALLAYSLLSSSVSNSGSSGIMSFFNRWSYTIARDARVGAVGLLALLTGPLAWGLFAYHVYLIWAGMTTNETNKWKILSEDMADGIVFKREKPPGLHDGDGGQTRYRWPVIPHQAVVYSVNERPPPDNVVGGVAVNDTEWERCWRLGQLENVYDLGFTENVQEVLFGTEAMS